MKTDNPNRTFEKFQLRLRSSVKQDAKTVSQRRGLSLNQFINQALAEKLDQLEQEEWINSRLEPTDELAARALALLDQAGGRPVEPGDALPMDFSGDRSVSMAG